MSQTFFLDEDKTDEGNAEDAIKAFPFLNSTSALNVVLWLQDRPSMNGIIEEEEIESLKGVVWQ